MTSSSNSHQHRHHHHHHQYHFFGGSSLISSSPSRHRHRSSQNRLRRNIPSTTVLRPIINNNPNDNIQSRMIIDDDSDNTRQSIMNNTNTNSDLLLNRMAILKAFGPTITQVVPLCNARLSSTNRVSKFEKPTSAREARKLRRQRSSSSIQYDPAVEEEFLRLRDSVPSIAGQQNVSDLTIINEAISLICDLESQLLHKLRCQLPDLREQFLK